MVARMRALHPIETDWGTFIVSHAPKNQEAASMAVSIGAMQMMKGSTNLPDENFEAH
jgi:hypothetical protein